jgi:hypothetical protein
MLTRINITTRINMKTRMNMRTKMANGNLNKNNRIQSEDNETKEM